MAADKIHVYKSSDNEYRVEPPIVELKAGQNFKFRNHSKEDLVFYVEAGALDANPKLEILKPGLSNALTPANQGTSGTAYTYSIIDPKTGKKAKGNSDPVMVVDN
jgi:hypothetical protein